MLFIAHFSAKHVISPILSEQYIAWRKFPGAKDLFTDAVSGQSMLRSFERTMFSLLHVCQMFVTARGTTGVVAGNCFAQNGDQIYFLWGGMSPFILRRVSDGYRLVSPCYLHAHMQTSYAVNGDFVPDRYSRLEKTVLV